MPKLVIELGLACRVCRASSTKSLDACLTYNYSEIVIDRVLVGYEHLAAPKPCDECGTVSRIPESDLSKTKGEVAQIVTVEWVRRAVWRHPDFPNSCYAQKLSDMAAKKFARQEARRQERIRLANRTPEQVAAARRYADQHYWCSLILQEELERAHFFNQLNQAYPCSNCGTYVSRDLYRAGQGWGRQKAYLCYACAKAEIGCKCQQEQKGSQDG